MKIFKNLLLVLSMIFLANFAQATPGEDFQGCQTHA